MLGDYPFDKTSVWIQAVKRGGRQPEKVEERLEGESYREVEGAVWLKRGNS